MLVLECALDALTLDEAVYPDTDQHYIYDHLKYCCSKSSTLPAVTVSVQRIPAVIIAGHKYFRIARELGRKSIRAIVEGGGRSDNLRTFLRRPDVQIIDNASIAQEVEDAVVTEGCQVYFFERPLSDLEKAEFEARIVGFYRTLTSPLLAGRERKVSQVSYSFGDRCAEFTATTPVGDESWYGESLRTCIAFSREVAKIASFQGGRFVW